ncbi:MAG: hypothetical protein LBJ57_08455 [Prevotellaceae bacterium]|nr:hypothetical protein [Prevotellaceae bacterium]
MSKFRASSFFDKDKKSSPALITSGFLLAVGDKASLNATTAAWGAIGHFWERNVIFAFVSPQAQRHILQLLRREKFFSVSFLPEEHKRMLTVYDVLTGRGADKIKKINPTPVKLSNGVITFLQASRVVVCNTLHTEDFIDPTNFIDDDDFAGVNIPSDIYRRKELYHMFIGEFVDLLGK